MDEHIQRLSPLHRRNAVTTTLIVGGIVIFAVSLFMRVTSVGTPGGLGGSGTSVSLLLVALGSLANPAIPLGAALFLIGVVNSIGRPSSRWLLITGNILCSLLLGTAVVWWVFTFLMLSFLG